MNHVAPLQAIFAGFALGCLPPVYAAERSEPPPSESPPSPDSTPPARTSGVEGRVVGGVVGGLIGGSRPEPAAGEPRTIYWLNMRVITNPTPSWPSGEPRDNDYACRARFVVDITGVPTSVVATSFGATGCPEPFIQSVQATAMTWRFETYLHEGVPTAVTFLMMFPSHRTE